MYSTQIITFILFISSIISISALPCDLTNQFCILAWNQQCPDENLNTITIAGTTYSFRNFDVIGFGDAYVSSGGYIEGRVAIENNFQAGASVTIGSGVSFQNGDISFPYSLIVGEDATWTSGSLLPDDTSSIGREDAWIGGTFTSDDSSLISRRTGSCAGSSSGCVKQYFESSLQFWIESSNRIAEKTTNAQYSLSSDGILTVVCTSSSEPLYFVDIDGETLSNTTDYGFLGCSTSSQFAFNIIGTSDITLTGRPFTYANGAIYNVIGSGRTLFATSDMYGTIVNVHGSFHQTAGVVRGQLICKDYSNIIAIARPDCPNNITTVIPTPTTPTGSGGEVINNNTQNTNTCPFVDFEDSTCSGLSFNLAGNSLSFSDYQVVVFGDITASSGDIQGRLAAKGTATFGSQFSVGDQIKTGSSSNVNRPAPFSLVASSLSWTGGNLFPDGIASTSAQENIFLGSGDSSNVVSYLQSRVTGSCADSSNCLNAIFDSAQNCYSSISQNLASNTDNVVWNLGQSQLMLTCSENAARYYVTIPGSALLNTTYYELMGCNSNSQWVLNVIGDEDVYIRGAGFPATPERVLYNIVGSGRTIHVSTGVNGAILSPSNQLDQPSGVIRGKVIVESISNMIQINIPDCPAVNFQGNGQDNDSNAASALFVSGWTIIAALLSLVFV